jgi:hypothetical protein
LNTGSGPFEKIVIPMKKLAFLLIILTIGLSFAVGSQTFPNAQSVANFLDGTWQMKRYCGGLAGMCHTPSSSGYTKTIVFSKISGATDSIAFQTTIINSNGTFTLSGHSKILPTSVMFGTKWTLENMNNGMPLMAQTVYSTTVDSLWLADNVSDGYTWTYYRDKTVGLNENVIFDLSIYPNPVNAVLHIRSSLVLKNISFQILDINGRHVNTAGYNGSEIDVSDLQPGMYFIFMHNSQTVLRKFFLKE